MKYTLLTLSFLMIPTISMAQLAANPWETKTVAQDQEQLRSTRSLSVNQNASENPWNLEQPAYIGDKTTWTIPKGQKEIAPDVNITNMLLMTQHLRNMGYQIPDGLDTLISTAPAKLRHEIYASMKQLQNSSHPVAKASVGFAEIFESRTGFSIDNLISNSLRLIDARR
ncbi:MAG: hypothetical protein ACI4QM_02565 [Alphaproteobacteria bacterium]